MAMQRINSIDEHKQPMKIPVRKTMNYKDYEATLYFDIHRG
jgi:hypothetical protein